MGWLVVLMETLFVPVNGTIFGKGGFRLDTQ